MSSRDDLERSDREDADAGSDVGDRGSRMRDLWIALTALAAALAALPLAPTSHSPEISAVLAMAAVALLAGHRSALPIIVIAEILLVGAVWPRAFLHDPPSVPAQLAAVLACAGALPGILGLRRAVPPLVAMTGLTHSRRASGIARALLVAGVIAAVTVPWF